MSGVLLKGALVSFSPTFLPSLVPNVAIFQYNPETMTHTWEQPEAASSEEQQGASNPLAVTGMPGERFSFRLQLDGDMDIADGGQPAAVIATVSGVASRLAALEMLLYPAGATSSLLGTVSAAISSALSGPSFGPQARVPTSVMPLTLFIWGPGRIVPVRVTDLTITEQRFDSALNPTHAEADVGLRVLTPAELSAAASSSDALGSFATVAYSYTLNLRQALAAANLAGAVGSVIGLIPH